MIDVPFFTDRIPAQGQTSFHKRNYIEQVNSNHDKSLVCFDGDLPFLKGILTRDSWGEINFESITASIYHCSKDHFVDIFGEMPFTRVVLLKSRDYDSKIYGLATSEGVSLKATASSFT